MKQNELMQAVYTYLDGLAGLPDVKYPNIEYDEPQAEYLNVFISNAKPQTLGIARISWYGGFIQIDCVVEHGRGELVASNNAQLVMDYFPIGTTLTNGSTTIRVDDTPYASAGIMRDDGWYSIPVTIPYNSIG